MIEPYTTKVLNSIKKVRGQMDLITKMIEDGRYCMDVVQQCNSAIGMLRQANNMVLESHLQTCGKKMNSSDRAEKDRFIKEILRACTISNRKN